MIPPAGPFNATVYPPLNKQADGKKGQQSRAKTDMSIRYLAGSKTVCLWSLPEPGHSTTSHTLHDGIEADRHPPD